MKWAALGIVPRLQDYLGKDLDLEEKIMKDPQVTLPRGACGEY